MANDSANASLDKVAFFKSTFRLLFALGVIASITLTERIIIPAVCHVAWQGSGADEVYFVIYVWLLSTLFIGVFFICGAFLALTQIMTGMGRDADSAADTRQNIISGFMTHPFPRWAISIAPAFGPPLAFAVVVPFYRTQFFFPDSQTLLLACSLLGLVSFVICLPLTIWSQKTLVDRFKEKYPEAAAAEEEEKDQEE